MAVICSAIPITVRYRGGGAGLHSPGSARAPARGGYFWGDPHPALVQGESPLITLTGSVSPHLF